MKDQQALRPDDQTHDAKDGEQQALRPDKSEARRRIWKSLGRADNRAENAENAENCAEN